MKMNCVLSCVALKLINLKSKVCRLATARTGGESGHVLVLAVTVLAVVFILGGASVGLGRAGSRSSFDHRDKIKVYYIAEAGVEKALARAKSDADWLWGLPLNTEVIYLNGQNFGEGVITSVKVKKESMAPASPGSKENLSSTTLVITSVGEYRNTRKTLKVKATLGAPLNYQKGIWLKSPLSAMGDGCSIAANVFADGNIDFSRNCSIAGAVTAGGNLSALENVSVTAGAAVAGGNINLYKGARLDGEVKARSNVVLYSGALIGSATTNEYGEIINWRDIYYNGSLVNNSGRTIDPSRLHPGQAGTLVLPQFPLIDLRTYENTQDKKFNGDRTFSDDPLYGYFNLDGICLVNGNVNISGTYRGVGVIVARGDVTIDGDLRKRDSGSSLLIITYGNNGINIHRDRLVYALLYAPPKVMPEVGNRKVVFEDGARLYGGVICDVLEMGTSSQFTFDGVMANLQPGWFTSAVSINSWEEEKQVF